MMAAEQAGGGHGISYRAAVARLAGAQKRARGGPAYTIYVNRWIGGRLAALAYVRGLTPNVLTSISAVCSLIGVASIALVDGAAPLAPLLLLVGYAFDAADGQLARLRGGGSLAGEWLDHMVDAVKTATLHLAVLIHLYRFTDLADPWLLVPVGFTVTAVTHYFAYLLNDLLRRGTSASGPLAPRAYEPASPRNAIAKLPVDYGVLCLSLLLLGSMTAFVAVYTFLLACGAAYVGLAAGKWYRDMSRLGR